MQTTMTGFFGVVFGAFGILGLIQTQNWILALPISRRRLLVLWLTPLLLAGLAGCAARTFTPWGSRSSEIRVTGYPKTLKTPLELWRLAGAGGVPVVRAPWGEQTSPAFRELHGRIAFNPYSVGTGNSERFLDWQEARAKIAIRSPELSWRIFESEAILLLTLVFLAVAAALTVSWKPMRRLPSLLRWMPAAAVFAGWMLMTMSPIWDWRWHGRDILVWLSWILPHTWAAVAMIPAVLLYFAVDKLFREGEFIEQARPAKQS